MTAKLDRYLVPLPTIATSICAAETGYIFVQMRSNRDRDSSAQLACFDFNGKRRWQRDIEALYPHAIKFARESLWMSDGMSIHQFDSEGVTTRTISVNLADHETIGDYLVTPDGFYICSRTRKNNSHRTPRILCLTDSGDTRWETSLPVETVAYEGVVGIGNSTNWEVQPLKPWSPRDWRPDNWQPLLLSGTRLLASYVDYSSGIGISYSIDTHDGTYLWATPPHPSSNKSIASSGQFFIGSQGYGAFETRLYDADGYVLQHWQSHGYVVITEKSEVRVVEMENRLPSKMHFVIYDPSGEVRKGPYLSRYYTSYPAVDEHDNVIFWREGELLLVDANLNILSLDTYPTPIPHHTMYSRCLLLEPRRVAFTRCRYNGECDLCLYPDAPVGALAKSIWACGNGNLGGNPVWLSV